MSKKPKNAPKTTKPAPGVRTRKTAGVDWVAAGQKAWATRLRNLAAKAKGAKPAAVAKAGAKGAKAPAVVKVKAKAAKATPSVAPEAATAASTPAAVVTP